MVKKSVYENLINALYFFISTTLYGKLFLNAL